MRRGTTLLELMMVVIVIGLLALLARPALAGMLDRAAVLSAASELVATLGAARHAAIVEGRFVAVRFDTSTARVVTVSGVDTLQRRDLRATHRVSLQTTRDSIAYYPTGRGFGAANTSIVLTRGQAADTILVSRLGRVRH